MTSFSSGSSPRMRAVSCEGHAWRGSANRHGHPAPYGNQGNARAALDREMQGHALLRTSQPLSRLVNFVSSCGFIVLAHDVGWYMLCTRARIALPARSCLAASHS
eukprot:6606551-Prymnesium_polylepis.2